MKKLFISLLFTFICSPVYSHGGENHGDSKPVELFNNFVVSKLYINNNEEILIKYSSFEINKLSNLDLFISDKNNNGLKLNKLIIYFDNEKNKVKSEFKNTNTNGWYQGHILFTEEGEYKSKLLIGNENIDLGIFTVKSISNTSEDKTNPTIINSIILLLLILIITALYIFFSSKKAIYAD